jgi:outer membrane receptor protein involved in Fe transport
MLPPLFPARLAAGAFLIAGVAHGAAPPPPPADAGADAAVMTEIQVTARRLDVARSELMAEIGTSEYRLGADDIKNLPLGEATPLNQVLLRAPGVSQDSFGQLHVRGDHANLQYRINDVVIPESMSLFGQALNSRFASEIALLTGALPAQYGYRTAGVVDIHTKGSAYREGGELDVTLGSRQHHELSGEATGSAGALTFYGTAGYLENNLGIENPQPTRDALHDHTAQWNGFGYASYLLPDASRLSLMLGASDNAFEIPTVPGRTPLYVAPGQVVPESAALDQNQREGNRFAILVYENAATAPLHYQVALYDRYTDLHYRPDPVGDLAYSGVAGDIARSNDRWGLQADARWKAGDAHTLRVGFTWNDERAETRADSTVYPLDGAGNVVYAPLSIAQDSRDRVRLWGGYLQDEWHPLEPLTVNYGLRYDRSEGPIAEDQLSPRLGLVYDLGGGTTLHAGYARYFTPPPTEKIEVETIALFQNTTGAPNSTGNDPVRSERSHYYDAGVLVTLPPALTIGLDAYYRDIEYLLDEGQFGSAVIFAPFNYAAGRIWGLEFSSSWRGVDTSAYLNAAYGSAKGRDIVSGQYNFATDELAAIAADYIHLDHDQRISASAGVTRQWRGTTLVLDGLFGTGLRRGFVNADHLPSYLTVNVAAHRGVAAGFLGRVDVRLSVVNVFDRVYELRDGSGVGVGAPQWGQRRTFYLSLGKSFGG